MPQTKVRKHGRFMARIGEDRGLVTDTDDAQAMVKEGDDRVEQGQWGHGWAQREQQGHGK